jgi:S1-C subfamily serine protease
MKQHFPLLITLGLFLSFVKTSPAATTASSFHNEQDRPYLGIYTNEVSEAKAALLGFPNEYGSYVSRVVPNSSAEKAGLQPFDYVYGINDARTSRYDDLTDLLEAYEPGDEVTIHYIRNGMNQSVPVTLGKHSDWRWSRSKDEEAFLGISPKDDEEDEPGVPVSIIPHTTAEELGLQDGDIITAINGYPMIDWTDITTAINNTLPGETIQVSYEREGRTNQVSGTIQSKAVTKGRSYSESRPAEHAFLGIQSSSISKEKAELLGFDNPYGSYVTRVLRGTAAEEAGIRPFDYIYGIDEYRTGEHQNLSQILRKFAPADAANVYLIRASERETLPVKLGRSSDVIRETRSRCEEPFFGIRHSHEYSPDRGVAVTIVDNSTAESLAMQDGDVITAINGHPIIDWQDVSIAIDNMEVGQTIEVEYLRDGQRQRGSQAIQSRCDTEDSSLDRDPDMGFNFDWDDDREAAPRQDVSGMEVDLSDISRGEAQEMEEKYGINMTTDNDLRIEGLRLFPNPATGMFNLEFNLPQDGRTVIHIFNASGRQIYNYDLGTFSGEFTDEIDIAQNGPGSYFLEVRQGSRSVTKKIILSQR